MTKLVVLSLTRKELIPYRSFDPLYTNGFSHIHVDCLNKDRTIGLDKYNF